MQSKKEKLWNLNFFLLWQGQLVSSIGSVAYYIALGFWILEHTGSTALMGTVMAVTTLPRVLIGPFAGAVIDKSNRKWIHRGTPISNLILSSNLSSFV